MCSFAERASWSKGLHDGSLRTGTRAADPVEHGSGDLTIECDSPSRVLGSLLGMLPGLRPLRVVGRSASGTALLPDLQTEALHNYA